MNIITAYTSKKYKKDKIVSVEYDGITFVYNPITGNTFYYDSKTGDINHGTN